MTVPCNLGGGRVHPNGATCPHPLRTDEWWKRGGEPAFTEAMLRRATPKWWQLRRWVRARRLWRDVQEHMKRDEFAFNGRREDFLAWDEDLAIADETERLRDLEMKEAEGLDR